MRRGEVVLVSLPGDYGKTRPAVVVQNDEVVSLVEESEDAGPGVDDAEHEGDEYRPRTARPDLEGEANEADVVEQASAVPGEDDDYA